MRKLIKNVNVYDGWNPQVLPQRKIVIEDDLVKEITAGDLSEDGFDEVIDGTGRTAMPGMIDAHLHLGGFLSKSYDPVGDLDYGIAVSTYVTEKILMAGFTTVRDAGGVVKGLKKAIDTGIVKGPRIYPSNSALSQTCGHGDSLLTHMNRDIQFRVPTAMILADGPDEVRRAVREQFFKGASQIKLMAGGGCASDYDPLPTVQFSEEEMRTAVETAKDYGTYVMAHLYTPAAMQRAARAGIRSFEHAHMMDEETAKMIQAYGIFVNPMPQFSKPMPGGHLNPKAQMVKKCEQTATELINKYDLPILFGTDLVMIEALFEKPGYEAPESVDITYYKKRFGNLKGLRALTGMAEKCFSLSTYQNPYQDGKIGVLEAGSYADLLLVDGDPTEDLDVLSKPDNLRLIMKDGIVYKNTLS